MPDKIPYPEIPRTTFVGRDDEMTVISRAISDKDSLRIVKIQGGGGIGKTSILNEISKNYRENKKFSVTEIIDFFDIGTNTPRGFLDRLASVLPEKYFGDYKKARYNADQIESSGITGEILRKSHEEVFNTFITCFNELSTHKRVIILIDTFELTQESLRDWLPGWMSMLKNSVVIIAGRNKNDWQGKVKCDSIELEPFKIEETKALFKLSEDWKNISNEELRKLQHLSKGLPVLLILAIDREWPRGQTGKDCSLNEHTFISEQYSLQELEDMSPQALEQATSESNIMSDQAGQ